jgi:DNA repair exonuclease SbcCD nuclease subunit
MAFRVLTAGDIHLGRRPVRLPTELDARSLTPAAAWRAMVDLAIAQRVDAVALTGDVVDQENRFYEAWSDLRQGVAKLTDAGIDVLAVAGNHDCDVLGRLAEQIEGFRLLGAGGRWETLVLQGAQGQAARFVGWSFPKRHVAESPMDDLRLDADSTVTMGLLHCDCPGSAGGYGPVQLSELTPLPVDLWALGHIHGHSVLHQATPLVYYTGAPQGLDPGEPGVHGAQLVSLEPGREPEVRMISLAGLEWQSVIVSLSEAQESRAVEASVVGAIETLHEQVQSQAGRVSAVGCRLVFRGRTAMHRELGGMLEELTASWSVDFDGITYFVEAVRDETRPDVDLEELARSNDPVGLLAEKLLMLSRGEPAEEYADFLDRAREDMSRRVATKLLTARACRPDEMTDEQIRDALLRAGFDALDSLLAQKEAPV